MMTLLAAIIIFLVSQYSLKFVLEPLSAMRRTLADVSSTVLFYQNKITNGHADPEASTELRKLSAGLRSAVFEVRFYRWVAPLAGVSSKENIFEACQQLNLLSIGMDPSAHAARPQTNWADSNTLALQQIGKLLSIQTNYYEI